MPALRPSLAAAVACVLLVTACGGSENFGDVCALAALPAQTPAQIDVLQHRAETVMTERKGKAFAGTGRNQRIFRAFISLQQSAYHAKFVAEASASGRGELASDLLGSFKSDEFNLTDLPKAQRDLRTACRT